ncbi:MAG TPA: glycosyltransferase, partial [Acidimicrobiales bacterium]|nr:glycosyltransferase [Acidimicrobiales bacterium]
MSAPAAPTPTGPDPAGASIECSYVLPLRRWRFEPIDELVTYLERLAEVVDDVVVVDGSAPPIFAAHAAALPPAVRHVPVDPARTGGFGKVNGVLTGVDRARHERIVLADDDVRYDRATLAAAVAGLDRAHLVRPQNHFDPLPWHARWDTSRSLLNRALGHDHPGTLIVRRSAVLATGGYDADVLFENLELPRTIEASGGRVVDAHGLFVARRPSSFAHFRSQRVRQAYDSFATPVRMAGELAVLPAVATALARRRPGFDAAGALATVAVAEAGRRRAGGARVFPPSTAWFAP